MFTEPQIKFLLSLTSEHMGKLCIACGDLSVKPTIPTRFKDINSMIFSFKK